MYRQAVPHMRTASCAVTKLFGHNNRSNCKPSAAPIGIRPAYPVRRIGTRSRFFPVQCFAGKRAEFTSVSVGDAPMLLLKCRVTLFAAKRESRTPHRVIMAVHNRRLCVLLRMPANQIHPNYALGAETRSRAKSRARPFGFRNEHRRAAIITRLWPSGICVHRAMITPFGGAGTVALVADRLQRDAVLIELNSDYARIASSRITGDAPLFAEVTA